MMLGNWSKEVAVAPSPVPDYFETPKAMNAREIAEAIDYHLACARNAVDGGFDGIEVHERARLPHARVPVAQVQSPR